MNQTTTRELVSGSLGILALGTMVGVAHAPLAVACGFALAAYVGGRLLLKGDDAAAQREDEQEALVSKGLAQGDELVRLARQIPDPILAERVKHMGERGRQMFEEIAENPRKTGDASSLADIYLPRMLTIVRGHIRLASNRGGVVSREELEETAKPINAFADFLKEEHRRMFREDIAELTIQSETLRDLLEIGAPSVTEYSRKKEDLS